MAQTEPSAAVVDCVEDERLYQTAQPLLLQRCLTYSAEVVDSVGGKRSSFVVSLALFAWSRGPCTYTVVNAGTTSLVDCDRIAFVFRTCGADGCTSKRSGLSCVLET